MKNKYFYLNTALPVAKLAIFEDGKLCKEEKWEAGRELSATLSQKFEELLKASGAAKKDLAGVIVFPGPGSFTGLRIGLAFANALAFGLSIPVFEGDENGRFNPENPKKQITPLYGAEPHITKPRDLQ